MNTTVCFNNIDDFMKDHPEIDPALKPLVEPWLKETEKEINNFVLHFLFL